MDLLRSSIGNECVIGKNVKILDSVIWDRVIIEDNCLIQGALICSDVTIKANSKISKGCVICSNVIVKGNVHIPEKSIVSVISLGKNGKVTDIPTNDEFFEKGGFFESFLNKNEEFNSEEKLSQNEIFDDASLTDEASESENLAEIVDFEKEVAETIRRIHSKESTIQTVLFEINNLKFGENKTFADCISAFMPEILGELLKIPENATTDIIMKQLKETFDFWKPLMIEYSNALEDGVFLIKQLEKFCNENSRFKSSFHVILQVILFIYTLLHYSLKDHVCEQNP